SGPPPTLLSQTSTHKGNQSQVSFYLRIAD
ncbi:MAG: hypothetical protein ACI8W3_000944, partial [Myxococcota bacterium]